MHDLSLLYDKRMIPGRRIPLRLNSFDNLCLPADWIPPTGWTEPNTALYQSFDNIDCLLLMEGTELRQFSATVPGKVTAFCIYL